MPGMPGSFERKGPQQLHIDAFLGKHKGGEERAQLKDTRTAAVFGDVQAGNPWFDFSHPLGNSAVKLSKSKSILSKCILSVLSSRMQQQQCQGFLQFKLIS